MSTWVDEDSRRPSQGRVSSWRSPQRPSRRGAEARGETRRGGIQPARGGTGGRRVARGGVPPLRGPIGTAEGAGARGPREAGARDGEGRGDRARHARLTGAS